MRHLSAFLEIPAESNCLSESFTEPRVLRSFDGFFAIWQELETCMVESGGFRCHVNLLLCVANSDIFKQRRKRTDRIDATLGSDI